MQPICSGPFWPTHGSSSEKLMRMHSENSRTTNLRNNVSARLKPSDKRIFAPAVGVFTYYILPSSSVPTRPIYIAISHFRLNSATDYFSLISLYRLQVRPYLIHPGRLDKPWHQNGLIFSVEPLSTQDSSCSACVWTSVLPALYV